MTNHDTSVRGHYPIKVQEAEMNRKRVGLQTSQRISALAEKERIKAVYLVVASVHYRFLFRSCIERRHRGQEAEKSICFIVRVSLWGLKQTVTVPRRTDWSARAVGPRRHLRRKPRRVMPSPRAPHPRRWRHLSVIVLATPPLGENSTARGASGADLLHLSQGFLSFFRILEQSLRNRSFWRTRFISHCHKTASSRSVNGNSMSMRKSRPARADRKSTETQQEDISEHLVGESDNI